MQSGGPSGSEENPWLLTDPGVRRVEIEACYGSLDRRMVI